MSQNLVAYFRQEYGDWPDPFTSEYKLVPTGTWKLVFNKTNDCTLYIGHRFLKFFTLWIHEDQIFFGTKERTFKSKDCKR